MGLINQILLASSHLYKEIWHHTHIKYYSCFTGLIPERSVHATETCLMLFLEMNSQWNPRTWDGIVNMSLKLSAHICGTGGLKIMLGIFHHLITPEGFYWFILSLLIEPDIIVRFWTSFVDLLLYSQVFFLLSSKHCFMCSFVFVLTGCLPSISIRSYYCLTCHSENVVDRTLLQNNVTFQNMLTL